MTSTSVASEFAPVSTSSQPRAEALESWAEGRQRPREAARALPGYFVRENGVEFAGRHLLVDLWGGQRLDDLALADATLREAVDAVGATLLHIHLHHFTPNGGISGVAVLAESHISIHTWPERGYAALDIFVCGDCDPEAAIPVLERAWTPSEVRVSAHRRGARVAAAEAEAAE